MYTLYERVTVIIDSNMTLLRVDDPSPLPFTVMYLEVDKMVLMLTCVGTGPLRLRSLNRKSILTCEHFTTYSFNK